MCFYTIIDYACGDWRWGNMRLRCARQHRIGETCGHRLSHQETNVKLAQPCSVCVAIATKQRRLHKAQADMARWKRRGGLPASVARASREAKELEKAIAELWGRRSLVRTWVEQTREVYQLPPMSEANWLSGASIDPVNSKSSSQVSLGMSGVEASLAW